jgi:hypothetical protein
VTSPRSSPNDAKWVLQRCYKGVTKAKDDCYRSVTGACQQHVTSPNSSPNDAEEVLQKCYRGVIEDDKGVTEANQDCYRSVPRTCQKHSSPNDAE